jgi:16S rRNA (guanine966-N2)-methyltransferase
VLRVVSGFAKGIFLEDVNKETTRPITSRIKTSLFDKIQFFIADEKVADLYSGTGSMGIEALSRGASFCDFVDLDSDCVDTIKKNLKKTKLENKGNVHCSAIENFVKNIALKNEYQVILYDPPFPLVKDSFSLIRQELLSFLPILKKEGAIIFRHPTYSYETISEFEVLSQKEYGISQITILTPFDAGHTND